MVDDMLIVRVNQLPGPHFSESVILLRKPDGSHRVVRENPELVNKYMRELIEAKK